MKAKRIISGNIRKLKCSRCGFEFPMFVFSGENDLSTEGLKTFTNLLTSNIHILDSLLDSEFNSNEDKWFEPKIGYIKSHTSSMEVETFQEFLKKNKKTTVIYYCPACKNNSAEVIRDLSVNEFIRAGGIITLDSGLVIC